MNEMERRTSPRYARYRFLRGSGSPSGG